MTRAEPKPAGGYQTPEAVLQASEAIYLDWLDDNRKDIEENGGDGNYRDLIFSLWEIWNNSLYATPRAPR